MYGTPLEVLSAGGTGSPMAPDVSHSADLLIASDIFPMRLNLPTLVHTGGMSIFESPCYQNVPVRIKPVPPSDEQCIIEQLVGELNQKCNTNLAAMCVVDRDFEEQDESSTEDALGDKRFILICASHMTCLECAFEDLGATVIDLSVPGWCATAGAVEEIRCQLSTVLEKNFEGETLLVYQLFDNSCYKSCDHNNE
jgi:hypothetical protein